MWKWIKSKFAKKKNDFSGFRVEIYRDGQLIATQRCRVDQILHFDSKCGPIIMDGVHTYGYTLTPHLEGAGI
jgi:hypothetical protein